MGRPSLLPEKQEAIIRLANAGNSIKVICERVGIAEGTMYRWLQWGKDDFVPGTNDKDVPADLTIYREFREAFRHSQTNPIVMCEASWLTAAKEGDWRAAKSWLTMHRPDVYKERIEIDAGEQMVAAVERWAKSVEDMFNVPGAASDDDVGG